MKKNTIKKLMNNKEAGFTILFAVIVSTLILSLGLGIVAITMKEVQLSGSGRDSELAYYAADSGLECAEYSDNVLSVFATSSASTAGVIKCNKQTLIVDTPLQQDSISATTTFTMYMEYNNANPAEGVLVKPCAIVSVGKSLVGTTPHTIIDSRGYNTCDTTNQRRLERGYRVEY